MRSLDGSLTMGFSSMTTAMPELLFSRYRDTIQRLDLAQVATPADIPEAFLLSREGRYSAHYIPFESVNTAARVVVVGITPGFVQWKNALREAQRQMEAGAGDDAVLRASRQAGAFSGAIRPNFVALLDAIGVQRWLGIAGCATLFGADAGLVQVSAVLRAARLAGAFSGAIRPNFVALLDAIGVQRWLGIASCATLFDADAGLVQVSGILRHPIFVDGKNYSGSPPMARHGFLRELVLRWFAEEARLLPDALYVPMGGSVGEALDWLAAEGVIRSDRILHGLPHPSGANAERVAYFLGRKDKAALSSKTNGAQIDAAREGLLQQMAALLASS